MKSIFFSLPAFLFLTLFSCEEVIEVDPGSAQAQIAVEGMIVNKTGESFVRLTRTAPYFSSDAPQPVTGASVTVADDHDHMIAFVETGDGRYLAPVNFEGVPGRTYSLTVGIDGRMLTAQSTMPDSLDVSNVRLEYIDDNNEEMQEGYYLYGTLNSDDPESNYFKSEVYVNGIRRQKSAQDLQVFDDRFFGGLGDVEGTFGHWTSDADDFLAKNDVLTIRLYALDKPAHDYLKALNDTPTQGGMYGRNPANVPSNIHGGVGLFHAAAYTTSEAVTVGE